MSQDPQEGYWGVDGTPFHEGEMELQKKFGVAEDVSRFAPRFLRPFMPSQHREFYESLPFLVVAARDDAGRCWSTLLAAKSGDRGFCTSPDPTTLLIDAKPVKGDALSRQLKIGTDLGIIGIEFATKRRNRVNGRIVRQSNDSVLEFRVDQSFGNCPQYIRPRKWWQTIKIDDNDDEIVLNRQDRLTNEQAEQIRNSDTLFLASGYPRNTANDDNPRHGNDASHRGGPKGWIQVKDNETIVLPNFHGNNMYNTMGNILVDNRMGLTVPLLATGGMIQMTGTADMVLDEETAGATYPGAKQLIIFHIEQVVRVPDGSLPLKWTLPEEEQENQASNKKTTMQLRVVKKIKESVDVTSFYLQAAKHSEGKNEGKKGEDEDSLLWPYRAGQHLPITLHPQGNANKNVLMRTYSLSQGPCRSHQKEYRISVKREPHGAASRFLHDHVQVGDTILADTPAGDFVLNDDEKDEHRTLVLVSAGVGLTPMLSMLHSYADDDRNGCNKRMQHEKRRKAVWVHGARDGDHHSLEQEVKEIQHDHTADIQTHIVYSRPKASDTGRYDSTGRVTAELLNKIVPDIKHADFFLCGPVAFLTDLEDGIQKLGVDAKRIQYETF